MASRCVLVFISLFTILFNGFSEEVNYSITNEGVDSKIVFAFNGTTPVKYTIGTKTAEYVMGYLANSTLYTKVEKKTFNYGSKGYDIVTFSNNGYLPQILSSKCKIGFLRADDGADIILFYEYGSTDPHIFKVTQNTDPKDVLKVDYVVGQIIKMMCFYEMIDGTPGPTQRFCISNISVTNGIPTNIEFDKDCQ